MTDQELIKTVCELLGIKCYADHNYDVVMAKLKGKYEEFNPLANTPEAKAFCWDLMITNDIDISYFTDYNDGESYFISDDGTGQINIYDKNPQRAVLLAFVELNKKVSL